MSGGNSDPFERGFLGIPEEFTSYERAASVILPVPFDGTCSWQRGTAAGPAAAIDASCNLELYDIESGSEPYRRGIHTAPAVSAATITELNELVYQAARRYISDGKFVLTIGGEHSISYGAIRAHAEKYSDLTVLQLDAHTDLREEYEGEPFSHACIMARTRGMVGRQVAVGIRSMDASELERVIPERTFFAEKLRDRAGWIKDVVAQLGPRVYITFDVDVLDPSILPATGTPEPGGFGWYETLDLLRAVYREREVVGADVVELMPIPGARASEFLVAKLIYKMLSYRELAR